METIETTGDTVEDAIAKGLEELGVGPGEVMVEVLEEPSRGLFGIGAKQARVRLMLIGGRRAEPTPPPAPEPIKPAAAPVATVTSTDDDGEEEDDDIQSGDGDPLSDEDLPEDAIIGRDVLAELLEKMQINANIEVRRAEATREGEEPPWMLNIAGRNTRNLIGRRGDTLASLQYIARLIASRRLQRRANIIVDVGKYKSQRSERLRSLANRMADQAVQTNRTITLEPMPPNERRIIHLTLRNREDVVTKSVGEGNSRKVTIVPA